MPRRPETPKIVLLLAALENAGCELSRDPYGIGYIAAPRFKATRFHRLRLDGADAPLLVGQIWDEAHRVDGREPVASFSKALAFEAMQALRRRAAKLRNRPHHQRVARLPDGRVIIDPGWETWRAIEISAHGWRILQREPKGVLFLRSSTFNAMPEPVRSDGADTVLAELQATFPNVRGDRMAILLAALAWSLVSSENHLLVLIHGRMNTGKSSLARLVRAIIDPNAKPYDPMPAHDTVRNLLAAGAHDRVLGLDNVSVLDRETADMLCQRLDGYGGGARQRQMHTNADLAVIRSEGPILINGIVPLVAHADLAHRAIVIDAGEVGDPAARPALGGAALTAKLDAMLPRLLGRLLTAAARGLRDHGKYGGAPGYRNVAFAAFAQAAAPVLGETAAGMAAMLTEMGAYQLDLAANAAPVASALLDMLATGPAAEGLPLGMLWRGTAIDLLAALTKTPSVRMDADFPRTGAALQGELIRLQSVLAAAGLRVLLRRAENLRSSPIGATRWIEVWHADPAGAAASELEEADRAGEPVPRH
jgi:putative DNA primase/helicase